MLSFLKKGVNKVKELHAEAKYKNQYRERVEAEIDSMKSTGSTMVESTAPFKLKKGEKYIAGVEAVLGTFKNDGNFKYGAMTARIKIAKGVHFRLGQGRIGMNKSWVYDQPGTLHLTTDRLIFNGVNKNTTLKWDKVIKVSCTDDGQQIYIDKESGSDLSFNLDSIIPESKLATALAFQTGSVKIAA